MHFPDVNFSSRHLALILPAILVGITVLLPSVSYAEEPSVLFKTGLEAFDKGDNETAEKSFLSVVKIEPANTEALVNLGLVAYKQQHAGLALAAWRRAVVVNPQQSQARWGLNTLRKENSGAQVFSGWLEDLNAVALGELPLDYLIFATLITLLLLGAIIVRQLVKVRIAFKLDETAPPFPRHGYLSAGLFSVFLTLSGLKIWHHLEPRATVISTGVSLRTGPGEDNSAVIDISEGSEVAPAKTDGDWVLVETPDGMQGWVQKTHLFLTAGQFRL